MNQKHCTFLSQFDIIIHKREEEQERLKEVSLVVIVLFLLSFVMPFGTVQAGTAVIQVDPAASTVNVGDVFKVNVTITDVTNLAVWEFQLYYLSSVLNCSQIVEGPFLKNGGNTFFTFNINNAYNATHGRLLAGSTLLGAVPGVNGSGTLATVTFKAKATGNTPLHLSDITLLDATPPPRNPIPHTTNHATVTVVSSYPIWDLNQDGKCDIKDLAIAAKAYGSYPGSPNWNPIADITGPTLLVPDGKVDIRDIALIAKHYGETY